LGCSGKNISKASQSRLSGWLEQQGAVFLQQPQVLAERLAQVRALVFDGDGVFNRGEKGQAGSSGFSEADSMGINLLRFALWRRDRRLPAVAIITGEQNAVAAQFAEREHLHALYERVKDKRKAMAHFRDCHGLSAQEIVCVFDDVNDLAMAHDCGIRILIRRGVSKLMRDYFRDRSYCDYVTASESGEYAVREAAELMLDLLGNFAEVVESRVAHDEVYREYFDARQAVALERVVLPTPA
jgi:3-deoxy-D-manno-octulosonate 8-phosphate phosphatase (KDO 8-P phosphatase)